MLVRSDEGFAEFRLPGFDYPLRVLLTPYTNGQRAKRYMGAEDADEGLRVFLRDHWAGVADKYCDTEGVNLLVAHLFMAREGGELPEEPEDERPINIGGADAVYTSLIPGHAVRGAGTPASLANGGHGALSRGVQRQSIELQFQRGRAG